MNIFFKGKLTDLLEEQVRKRVIDKEKEKDSVLIICPEFRDMIMDKESIIGNYFNLLYINFIKLINFIGFGGRTGKFLKSNYNFPISRKKPAKVSVNLSFLHEQ